MSSVSHWYIYVLMYLFIFYTLWILAILPSVHFGQKSSLVRLSLIRPVHLPLAFWQKTHMIYFYKRPNDLTRQNILYLHYRCEIEYTNCMKHAVCGLRLLQSFLKRAQLCPAKTNSSSRWHTRILVSLLFTAWIILTMVGWLNFMCLTNGAPHEVNSMCACDE